MLTDIVAAVNELVQDPVVLIVAAVALLALAVVLTIVVRRARRRTQRRQRLQKAFGPEYDRTTGVLGRRKGERDLADRLERHGRIERRLLEADAVTSVHGQLEDLQVRFVDAPTDTVSHADELVRKVAVAVGYPEASNRDRLFADISVDHPAEVAAHQRALDPPQGRRGAEPSTEELRASLLAARALLDALLAPSVKRLAESGLAPRRRELRDSGALAALLADDEPDAADDHRARRPGGTHATDSEVAATDHGVHETDHDVEGTADEVHGSDREVHETADEVHGSDRAVHATADEVRGSDREGHETAHDADREVQRADDVFIELPEHEHAHGGHERADEGRHAGG